PTDEDRLRDVEKKLRQLLDEVDALRKEVRPKKPAHKQVLLDGRDLMTVATRDFSIPFRITPDHAGQVLRLTLWHTRDGGRTWRMAQAGDGEVGKFDLGGMEDGVHGFSVTVTDGTTIHGPAPQPSDTPQLQLVVKASD